MGEETIRKKSYKVVALGTPFRFFSVILTEATFPFLFAEQYEGDSHRLTKRLEAHDVSTCGICSYVTP